MHSIHIALVLVTMLMSCNAMASNRCRRGIRQCPSIGGLDEFEDYEECTHICCGSSIHERDANLHCCGNETVGEIFNSVTQLCCAWPYGGQFTVYDKGDAADDAYCCGTELFSRKENPTQSCCNGYLNPPQVFDVMTEMCCGGNAQFAGTDEFGEPTTAYASCCGDTSYDRRVASCPCHNGVIGIGIPENETGCCYSDDRRKMSPYNRFNQECCNWEAFDPDTEFCCGGSVGTSDAQACCGNVITDTTPELAAGTNSRCCVLSDGSTTVYDEVASICCGGSVQSRDIEGESICCGETVYTVGESGDACCGDELYSTSFSVCCDGIVGEGDSCCNGQYYSSTSGLQCCRGEISEHDFRSPSCCVNQTFDSFVQTCCGGTLYENPLVPDEEGGQRISHTTRCCGDFSDDRTLAPYDYLSQLCCEGNIIDLGELPWDGAECCGDNVMERGLYSCCNGNMVENEFGEATTCCGDQAVNRTNTICCNGEPQNTDGIAGQAVCCGSDVLDRNEQICCNGKPRSLNGVPPERAICCGDGCIDGSTYWCCNGMQYRKGADNGEAVRSLECGDLFR